MTKKRRLLDNDNTSLEDSKGLEEIEEYVQGNDSLENNTSQNEEKSEVVGMTSSSTISSQIEEVKQTVDTNENVSRFLDEFDDEYKNNQEQTSPNSSEEGKYVVVNYSDILGTVIVEGEVYFVYPWTSMELNSLPSKMDDNLMLLTVN